MIPFSRQLRQNITKPAHKPWFVKLSWRLQPRTATSGLAETNTPDLVLIGLPRTRDKRIQQYVGQPFKRLEDARDPTTRKNTAPKQKTKKNKAKNATNAIRRTASLTCIFYETKLAATSKLKGGAVPPFQARMAVTERDAPASRKVDWHSRTLKQ